MLLALLSQEPAPEAVKMPSGPSTSKSAMGLYTDRHTWTGLKAGLLAASLDPYLRSTYSTSMQVYPHGQQQLFKSFMVTDHVRTDSD